MSFPAPGDISQPSGALLPHHQKLIDDSAIAPEVASARGYRSVTDRRELANLGFSRSQCLAPCLLVPIWDVHGKIAMHQIRPDKPRVIKGKTVKYDTPAGAHLVIDVPPDARGALDDPTQPLWITEGSRKADAAVSKGLVCIGLLGVWGWRGKNAKGGKVALPDWDSIALNDRDVYVAFDSDVMTKREVHTALTRLQAFLARRGAKLHFVYLPEEAAP